MWGDDPSVIDKKHNKKAATQARNKKNLRIFRQVGEQLENIEEARAYDEEIRDRVIKSSPKDEPEVWSAKVGEVRNKLTNRKRAASERWNRFAGTSGGGGRGL